MSETQHDTNAAPGPGASTSAPTAAPIQDETVNIAEVDVGESESSEIPDSEEVQKARNFINVCKGKVIPSKGEVLQGFSQMGAMCASMMEFGHNYKVEGYMRPVENALRDYEKALSEAKHASTQDEKDKAQEKLTQLEANLKTATEDNQPKLNDYINNMHRWDHVLDRALTPAGAMVPKVMVAVGSSIKQRLTSNKDPNAEQQDDLTHTTRGPGSPAS